MFRWIRLLESLKLFDRIVTSSKKKYQLSTAGNRNKEKKWNVISVKVFGVVPSKSEFNRNRCDLQEEYSPFMANLEDGSVVVGEEMKRLAELLLICLVPTIASHCPSHVSSKIQECVRPVAEYAKLINNDQEGPRNAGTSEIGNAFSLPNMGRRVFNGLCKLIAKFNVCVREYRMQCLRHVTISIIDSSYGYLCNEGYNTFMESAECLMELDRKPEVKKCHDETLVEIETANSETGIAMAEKLDRMCGALNFFAGCVKSPIKHECGSSAWQVIYRVLKDTTNTLMPGCHFTGASTRLLSSEAEGKAPLTTVTQPILTTTESTSTTTTTASPVKDYARFPSEEAAAQSRKGLSKSIVSEELAQTNSIGSLLSLSLLLFVLMIFSF